MNDGFPRRDVGNFTVLEVLTDLDLATVRDFAAAVLAASEGGRPIIVDLSACEFVDSTGLRAVADARPVMAPGSRFVVPRQGSVRRLFAITGFDQILEPAETLAEALRSVGPIDAADAYG